MLKVGNKLPKFNLENQDGETVTEKDFIGQYRVLYFYPKDNTSGCTKEACDFTTNIKKFQNLEVEVFGVSPDSVKKHQNFIQSQKLKVNLLADVDKKLCNAMGVIGEKKMYGKTYLGVMRTTFIIDPQGKIAEVFEKVKVDGHVKAVHERVKELVNTQFT